MQGKKEGSVFPHHGDAGVSDDVEDIVVDGFVFGGPLGFEEIFEAGDFVVHADEEAGAAEPGNIFMAVIVLFFGDYRMHIGGAKSDFF